MALGFHISTPVLPAAATVVAFRGSEGISRPYTFDIYVNVAGSMDVDLDDAPGAKVSLTIEAGSEPPVEYNGMIAQLELIRATHLGTDTANALYLVRLVPHLWALSLTKHSRIFTKQSIPDVIKAVLQDEGIHDVDLRLNRSYETEEHVTQYKESSLHFIHRWMEREGLYYFFEQSGGSEKLVITDDKSHAAVSRKAHVRYQPSGDGNHSAGAHFDTFIARNGSLPGTVRFSDYDYMKPHLDVKGHSKVSKGAGEHVTYGNRFFTPDKGDALAAIRAEDLRARAKNVHASGGVTHLSAGYRFSVEHHPKTELNTEYLAVTVDHFGRHAHSAASWGKLIPNDHDEEYRVDVTAILATQQYRHPETAPWPRIDGFENATVDGPAASEYAQIDDQGRYSVKFKFDEGTLKDGKASTYVRKMQPHAGTVEGWHFPERKGTEIVCAFLGGDPDRPVIIGAIPTAIHASPVTSANHTQNVIQTGGYNRFEIEDLSGQQRVTLSTPHAKTHLLMGNPKDGHEFIARTEGNSLHHTDINHKQHVGVDCVINIGSNHDETIGATKTQTVTGDVKHVHKSDHNHTTKGDHKHKTEGDHDHTTKGDHKHKTEGDHDHTTKGDHKHKTEGDKETKTEGEEKWEIGLDLFHHIGGQYTKIIDGFTNWTFEAAKNETVAGMCNNKFLGVKMEWIGGVKIETIIGAEIGTVLGLKMEICATQAVEIAPEATEMKALKNEIKGLNNEMKGVDKKLEGAHDAIVGLKKMTGGLYLIQKGVGMKEAALDMCSAGLKNTNAGLHMME